jgi:phosphopantothenoylcysteine decarboxylase/phosphopantothenate--cysteine ligase
MGSRLRGAHPSRDIVGVYSESLRGKCVVLGVTGSVAAYRSIDAARWLMRRGAEVRVILTKPAADLVSPRLFYWATGAPPIVELSGEVEHIELARTCDSMAVAPATLSTMSKIAWGITDNPVALTAVSMAGLGKPVLVFPAMHGNMAETIHYQEALAALARKGYAVIEPLRESGVAKFHDPRLVARLVAAVTLRGRDMSGLEVLVTAGATREWIDRVRFISNPSSGRMGVEAALEAYARGARVVLLHGMLQVEVPPFIEAVRADTTEEMAARMGELTSRKRFDVIVAAAAPADYRPAEVAEGKLPSGLELSLRLLPTPKVLASIGLKPRVLVAFAAETVESLDELEARALAKMEKYSADIVVGNIVGEGGSGFSSLTNTGVIVTSRGEKLRFNNVLKEDLARLIFDKALDILEGSGLGVQ